MRLLLDTCVVLWFFEGSERLAPTLRDRLTDASQEVYVSTVSLFEIVLKHQVGKLPLPDAPHRLLPALLEAHGLDTLDLAPADMFELGRLPMCHRDPFDRLLIAQARARRLTLVTPDAAFIDYDVKRLWT